MKIFLQKFRFDSMEFEKSAFRIAITGICDNGLRLLGWREVAHNQPKTRKRRQLPWSPGRTRGVFSPRGVILGYGADVLSSEVSKRAYNAILGLCQGREA